MALRWECSSPYCRRLQIARNEFCALHDTPSYADKPIALVGGYYQATVIHEPAGSRWTLPKCGVNMDPGVRLYNLRDLMLWKKRLRYYSEYTPRECRRCYST